MSKPLFPYVGGKRKLAKHILPLFPVHKTYVEPFCGAAAIFFLKEPSKAEVLNDINGELINLYRVVAHHLEEFYKQFKWALYSRQIFEWERLKHPHTLTDIQRAVRFMYLQKSAFGGKVAGQSFGAGPNPAKFNFLSLESELSSAHLRLQRVVIEHRPWAAIIEQYDRSDTLFYCDPPYWQTEGYGVDFGWEQYEQLAALAGSIQGKLVISLNDHPDIRSLFKGLRCQRVDYRYTVASKGTTEAGELMLMNF
jgi:DNA adenine methylase